MASMNSWKLPLQNQEMAETQTFTWRLRPHVTHQMGQNDSTLPNPARNSKSTNLSGVARLLNNTNAGTTTNASHSISSSNLPTATSLQQIQPQSMEKFLRYQEFEIEGGQSLGLHSLWSLFLISCGSTVIGTQKSSTNVTAGSSSSNSSSANSDFIGLFLRKVLKPGKSSGSSYSSKKGDLVVARYKIEIMDRDGELLYTKEFEATARDTFEVGFWDWKKIVPLSRFYNARGKFQAKEGTSSGYDYGGSAVEESLLLLRVSFTMASRRRETGKGRMADGDPHSEAEVSTREAANAFLDLVTSSKSLQPDVIIEIPNRRKFSVHKKMLVGRSQFFMKVLGTGTNERRGGSSVVKLDDVSANTMELILKHIYTGQLEEEWTTNPVTITELIYASEKYGLPALKQFCSKHLVKAATKNNCYKLMEVAQLHNLDQAAEDLMSYASEGISSNPQSRKASTESVEAEI